MVINLIILHSSTQKNPTQSSFIAPRKDQVFKVFQEKIKPKILPKPRPFYFKLVNIILPAFNLPWVTLKLVVVAVQMWRSIKEGRFKFCWLDLTSAALKVKNKLRKIYVLYLESLNVEWVDGIVAYGCVCVIDLLRSIVGDILIGNHLEIGTWRSSNLFSSSWNR